MEENAPQYIQTKPQDRRLYWDWWRENPAEIVLVIFIIALFALVPWEGCGISEQDVDPQQITILP